MAKKKQRQCIIWWMPGGFGISESGTWLPGVYTTLTAARRAFDFADDVLKSLAERVHGDRHRLITEADLPPGGPGPAVVIRHGSMQTTEFTWDDGSPPELPWCGEEWQRGDLVYSADASTGRGDTYDVKTQWISRFDLTHDEREAIRRGESVADRVTARLTGGKAPAESSRSREEACGFDLSKPMFGEPVDVLASCRLTKDTTIRSIAPGAFVTFGAGVTVQFLCTVRFCPGGITGAE